ncbi:NAD(P)-binding protein [Roseomonas frigidaquae]|uniref:NAD(P)-binding protein n=1 Tax=Falsiroseomonas frigidaquae TaxID=487318 RepID=A0ABX1ET27_9PROT|nr:FAD-dependent monooxygenase [Falsiroseomonas frigidaquae]NKE43784.1 NAD(P)-binding protein [Falsiroseomonas frigidaquae]
MQGRGHIGIVGAGLGGLAAAALLLRAGYRVTVFEQAPGFARVGAGIQMGANAMKALRALGLDGEVRRIGFRPESLLNRDHDTGAVTNELPGGDALEARYGAPHMCLHRADLHAALAAAVPAEHLRLGRKLAGLDQHTAGVTLTFTDGARETVDAVIAADGVHSVVREQMLGAEAPRFTGRVAYRTVFPAALLGDRQLGNSRTKWWGQDRHLVMYYITAARDEVYFVTSQPEDPSWMTPESWSARGDVEALRASFADFHPDVRHVLAACPQVWKWALLARDPLPHWVEGRVALLGDACHPMSPYMAQGAAMALEDAVILSRCLAETEADGIAGAFRRYEANRMPRATDIQSLSAENTFLRRPGGTDWVYGYDATTAPLDEPGTRRAAA